MQRKVNLIQLAGKGITDKFSMKTQNKIHKIFKQERNLVCLWFLAVGILCLVV